MPVSQRKLIFLIHTSLDGFVATADGDISWIRVNDELFDDTGQLTARADTALYGRVTYGMMESYWPTAAQQPTATRHDVEHGEWANAAQKLVVSTTLEAVNWQNTRIVRDNPAQEIAALKTQPGKHLLLLGSPTLAQTLMRANLIDEYHITVSPVVLGGGRPLFPALDARLNLNLESVKTYGCGTVWLQYTARE